MFLDRDGIILRDVPYLRDKEKIEWNSELLTLLRLAQKQGFIFIVVSNQSGIGRGLISVDEHQQIVHEIYGHFERNKLFLRDYYYCPHHPNNGIKKFKVHCLCRKPLWGLFYQASVDHNIDLSRSMMLGDKGSDAINLFDLKCYLVEGQYKIPDRTLTETVFKDFDQLFIYWKNKVLEEEYFVE